MQPLIERLEGNNLCYLLNDWKPALIYRFELQQLLAARAQASQFQIAEYIKMLQQCSYIPASDYMQLFFCTVSPLWCKTSCSVSRAEHNLQCLQIGHQRYIEMDTYNAQIKGTINTSQCEWLNIPRKNTTLNLSSNSLLFNTWKKECLFET